MDTYQHARNDNSLNHKNPSRPTYMSSKSPQTTSSLLPPFVSQSRNSHLPTPQSPSNLQLNNYIAQSQESPDARYFASSRPGSANPPLEERNFPSTSSSAWVPLVNPFVPRDMTSNPHSYRSKHTQLSHTQHSSRLIASEPRHGLTSYSKHAIVTPSPELSRTQLPSNDPLMTPTPQPTTAKPALISIADQTYSRSYSPEHSSIYQSSPDHHQQQHTTHPQSRRHQRQRTMSIDEPATPILNLNLALARHASDAQQSSKHDTTDHGFDPDDPFIEQRGGIAVDGSVSALREGGVVYRESGRNSEGFEGHGHRRSASPPGSRTQEGTSQPQYSETPLGESWHSSPEFSSPKRPPRRTESPLTPWAVTPPPLIHRSSADIHPKTPPTVPSRHKYSVSQPITPPPPRYSRLGSLPIPRTSSPSVDSTAPGGELTRIKASRARLEEERAAASEPRRPDYLVRTVDTTSNHMNLEHIPEPQPVTPVKRRDTDGFISFSEVKRKRPKVGNEDEEVGDSTPSRSRSGLGIIVTPTRGRRLTLYQPKPRLQNSGVDLSMMGAHVEGNNGVGKEEPRTPPPFSHPLTRPSHPPSPHIHVPKTPSPPLDPTTTSAPYTTLAIRSIDWHTPRSSRNLLVSSSSAYPSLQDEEDNNQVFENQRRHRLAIKERRLAAFRVDKPSNRGSCLRPYELVNRGRIVIDCGDEEVGDLVDAGVVADIPSSEPSSIPSTEPVPATPSHPSTVPDWPDHLHPWSTASQKHVEKAEQERAKRLAYIERYLDRESESESEEDMNAPLLGHTGGMGLVFMYDALAKGNGKKGRRGGSPSPVMRSGRAKMVALSEVTSTKARKSGAAGGRGNRAVKKSSHSTAKNASSAPSTSFRHHLIFPTSTADARLALLSRKRVRLLAEKLREREEEGVVMCICQGGDDGRAMVRCDRCRVWYHLVCVDIRDADELGEEWFCFKCVGDDDDDEEEEEEGTLDGEEEEEELGVAVALDRKARTQILDRGRQQQHASNASVNVKSGANVNGNVKSRKKQQQQRVDSSSRRQEKEKPKSKPRQRQRQQQQAKPQKVPDFAPAMPESPVRPGVGDQMLFQHHQTFPLQPSPMPPSPVRRRPTPGRRHVLSSTSSSTAAMSSSSSSSRHYSYNDIIITNDSSSSYNRSRSPSRSRSRDGNGLMNNNSSSNNDSSSLNLNYSHITAPSTPRRSSTSSSSKPFNPYSYSSFSSSSPTKLGFPSVYLTPKPSYDDDAPFDPTSTPSRGLKFHAPPGPVTPISSSRSSGAGGSGAGGTFGRYGYGGYGYGGFGFGSGSGSGLGSGSGVFGSQSSLLWGTPQTPTNAVGGLGRGGEPSWSSGWGDESPVRRKKPVDTAPALASSSSATTTLSSTVHPRRNALLDSPIFIGPSSSSGSGSLLDPPTTSSISISNARTMKSTPTSTYPAGSSIVEDLPPISSSRDSPPGPGPGGKVA